MVLWTGLCGATRQAKDALGDKKLDLFELEEEILEAVHGSWDSEVLCLLGLCSSTSSPPAQKGQASYLQARLLPSSWHRSHSLHE